MKKVLKYVLLISFLSLAVLFCNQTVVKAVEINTISTMEELKTAFGGKATIDRNIIKLTDNVLLENALFEINIPEVIIDFNGKTLEYKGDKYIKILNKVTFQDSSTTNRQNWGEFIFNGSGVDTILVEKNAELIINSGKFIDGGIKTSSKINVYGKITINDATFSTKRTQPVGHYNYMIQLRTSAIGVINGGEFSHTDTIIYVGGDKYRTRCELTINGGNFTSVNMDAIMIYALYPYVDKNNNNQKEVIIPKIIINDCNVNNKHGCISFWGGCVDEEFINTDTKILTINGGTYKGTKESAGTPLGIYTYTEPNTYFNPKDLVLNGGTFESLNSSVGAITLFGPCKRRI